VSFGPFAHSEVSAQKGVRKRATFLPNSETGKWQKGENWPKPALNQALNPAGRAGIDKPNSETGINPGGGEEPLLGPGPAFNNCY